jgi:CubicO group peptidase (beta-lactamase class C family)
MQLDAGELRRRIEPLFQENFQKRGELGAAVSIWQDGKPILELQGGFRDARREQPWTPETIVLVWSATKGIGSACLLHALQENAIDLSRRVIDFWPEFGQNGKGEINLATVMSHRAGLCALNERVDILDYPGVISALQRQSPLWAPGKAHGYHARTFGFLLDELTRRITGLSVPQYWRRIFAEPLALDFWIGLPNELNERVATMYAPKAGGPVEPTQFYRDLSTPGTLPQRTFTSPAGLDAISAMNKPEIRAHPLVSFGGIGSATALAKFYAMLANDGTMDGRRYFAPETIRHMAGPLSSGIDLVFEIPTAFSAGFMVDAADARKSLFGRRRAAFGNPGAGGSHAFSDLENRIAFAYVMNQMEQAVLPNEKSLRLVDAIYAGWPPN